jgi:glyoxylase-like metal-dependent hydrolase (beta-lactamase superfamily II)
VVEAKPILQVRAPNLTFTRRLAFHGSKRSAELIEFVGGHTQSDLVLWLPGEGIAFMGDLLFVGCHPWLGGCDPDSLPGILDAVSGLAPRVLVPGHGPVGTADSVAQMQEYVLTLDGLARAMIQRGEPEERIDGMAIPEPYNRWQITSFFAGNLRHLYRHRLREQAGQPL